MNKLEKLIAWLRESKSEETKDKRCARIEVCVPRYQVRESNNRNDFLRKYALVDLGANGEMWSAPEILLELPGNDQNFELLEQQRELLEGNVIILPGKGKFLKQI